MDRKAAGSWQLAINLFVALRKESVDRKFWSFCRIPSFCIVALRKESVDRKTNKIDLSLAASCRSPQGERG